jgi:hypothetical protein
VRVVRAAVLRGGTTASARRRRAPWTNENEHRIGEVNTSFGTPPIGSFNDVPGLTPTPWTWRRSPPTVTETPNSPWLGPGTTRHRVLG